MVKVDILVYTDGSGKDPSFILGEGDNPLLLSSSGIQVLAGRVMRELLTRKGSSLTKPNQGSILATLSGQLFDKNSIRSDVARSIISVSESIKRSQVGKAIPDSELLARLEVVSIETPTPDSLVVRILIVSLSGEQVLSTVGV